VPAETIVAQVLARLASGTEPDYVTLSGSGEPTLNTAFGQVVRRLKENTTIPLALITNSTLFRHPDVRRDAAATDVVLPSLDAGTEAVFRRLNRPHPSLSLAALVEGLVAFRQEYGGPIWLECFMVKGLNTSPAELAAMKAHIGRILPDKIQLNTAVRPTADGSIARISEDELRVIAELFGPRAEVVADFSAALELELPAAAPEVLDTIRRRPSTVEDVASGLGVRRNEAAKIVGLLESQGRIRRETRAGRTYFVASPAEAPDDRPPAL
jgi:wyosine [tRNA(Phe)-imidazoG37] synthetase (radical SAM superfamily)